MRSLTLIACPLLALFLGACAPSPPPAASVEVDRQSVRAIPAQADTVNPEESEPLRQNPPSGKVHPTRLVRTKLQGIAIEALIYDSRRCQAVVLDQKQGPGTTWPSARAAAASTGAIAAVNAGFFTPEGDPLGLVIAGGDRRGGINRASSLGSGFYALSSSGNPELLRRSAFKGAKEAVQSGPFLVERGRAVGGLSDQSSSARTFIATDGGSGWMVVRTGPCSLSQLAPALEGASIGAIRVRTALNLDGGRSSELWVSDQVSGGGTHTRPIWNKPVRNFLAIKRL